MEAPIQLIMTMFVVLLVGSLVILFSQNLLADAEQSLPKIKSEYKNEDGVKILEVDSFTNQQIAFLVDECYNTRFEKVFKDEFCFIIHSSDVGEIKKDAISNGLFKGEMLGSVEEGEHKTVLIKWNFFKTSVDVSS